MGGLTSLASTAIQAIGAANTVIGAIDKYQNGSGRTQYDQTKAQNDLILKNAKEQASLQKEQMRINADAAETERRNALRRAIAKQRAQFGASGISQGDGSSQAVLLGMFDESDEERQQREALDALKTASIDQNVGQQARVNTLQLTQLQEKNRLNKVSSALGSIGDLGSIVF